MQMFRQHTRTCTCETIGSLTGLEMKGLESLHKEQLSSKCLCHQLLHRAVKLEDPLRVNRWHLATNLHQARQFQHMSELKYNRNDSIVEHKFTHVKYIVISEHQ